MLNIRITRYLRSGLSVAIRSSRPQKHEQLRQSPSLPPIESLLKMVQLFQVIRNPLAHKYARAGGGKTQCECDCYFCHLDVTGSLPRISQAS